MSEHVHTPPSAEVLQFELSRRQQIIDVQRDKLAVADDKDTALQAELHTRKMTIEALQAMIGQVTAENRILRKRLGLGETEPIEVDDESDAAELGDAILQDPPAEQ